MSDPIVVVNVSGGAGSALALLRCIESYGHDRIDAVFADTRSETPDTYTFLDQLEEAAGVPIKRLSDGRDIWDVFRYHRIMKVIHSGGACKASVELKQLPLAKYVSDRYQPGECVIATGLDWMEPERQDRLVDRLAPYDCLFPLNDRPRLSRCQIIAELEDKHGLTMPGLYAEGYPHNNCGRYGCILAGKRQWAGLLHDRPEAFAMSEANEQGFMELIGKDFTILRDDKGGERKSYSLRQLREDVEAGREFSESWRSMCDCMGGNKDQGNLFDILREEGCDA